MLANVYLFIKLIWCPFHCEQLWDAHVHSLFSETLLHSIIKMCFGWNVMVSKIDLFRHQPQGPFHKLNLESISILPTLSKLLEKQ